MCISFPKRNKNNVSIDSVYIQQTLDSFYELAWNYRQWRIFSHSVALYNQNKLTAKTLIDFKTLWNHHPPFERRFHYVSITDKGLTYDNTYYFSIETN
jgi:hypothetical protein